MLIVLDLVFKKILTLVPIFTIVYLLDMLILVEHGTCFLFIYLFIEKSHLTYYMTIHKTIHIYIVPALVSVQLSILVDYDFMFWFQQIFKHIEVGIIYIYTQI